MSKIYHKTIFLMYLNVFTIEPMVFECYLSGPRTFPGGDYTRGR